VDATIERQMDARAQVGDTGAPDAVPSVVSGFLIALCRSHAGLADEPQLQTHHAVWGMIVAEAARHRMLPFVARYIAARPHLENGLRRLAEDALAVSRRRQSAYRALTLEVQAALADAGVASLCRKGAVYERLLYDDQGLRPLGDLDLFVLPAKVEAAAERLQALGFFYGGFLDGAKEATAWGRQEVALYRLNPDHLPRLMRPADDPIVRAHYVDVATDVAWHRSPYSDAGRAFLEDQFAQRVEIDGVVTLTLPGHFIDCVFHLYREAMYENGIRGGNDASIRKFLDVLMLHGKMSAGARKETAELIRRHAFEAPVAWVLVHLDAVFGTGLAQAYGLEGVVDPVELNSWRTSGNEVRRWQGAMVERMFRLDRRPLFAGWPQDATG